MRRISLLFLLGVLAACQPLISPLGERGIGGTGSPPAAVAERGIGGTGGPALGAPGTGIVGVITGFGSIFVNGFEVRYTPQTPVEIDGAAASPGELRAGQVVAIDASGPLSALTAESVAVRHEVAGPVEAVSAGQAVIAGQTVALGETLSGAALVRPGAWVAVSGLRRPDGTIAATRIGHSPAGLVRVSGRLTEGPGGLAIGRLALRPPPGVRAVAGQYVTLAGRYQAGRLVARSIAPDRLATNPMARFGPRVGRVFVESYASAARGRLTTPGGLSVRTGPAVGTAFKTPRWSIITLERGPGGVPHATGLRFLARPTLPPAVRPGGFSERPHRNPPGEFRRPGDFRRQSASGHRPPGGAAASGQSRPRHPDRHVSPRCAEAHGCHAEHDRAP